MKNKKSLLCISALMILIFHLWVPIFNNGFFLIIEKYIRYICCIGVDIFFFISAYSLAKRKIVYKEFIKNRFINIYLKFIVFLIIASIYKNYSMIKFVSIFSGIELFIKGGGSFLWFIPSIMILYLIIPLYSKLDSKYKYLTPLVLFILWFTFTIIVSLKTNYNAIFIFTNRIPIFMIGYYASKYNVLEYLKKKNIVYILSILILLIIGNYLSYTIYAIHYKVNFIYDSFYLINIPLILGMILLIDLIPNNKVINLIGTISLELYAFQMIFGFRLVNSFYSLTDNSILTNIITFLILIVISYLFSIIYKKTSLIIKKLLNKKVEKI